MKNHVKKLIRSAEMMIPGSIDLKYYLSDTYYTMTRKVYKNDLNGLRFFNTTDALMIDVGSNRGQCIRAFKNIDPTLEIVAFEPVPFLTDKLANWYKNDSLTTVVSCALSNVKGSTDISVPFYNGLIFDGMSSIDPSDINKIMRLDRFFWYDERKLSMVKYKVPVRTLDSFNLAPNFIKLHAQRHEIEIIRGAVNTIRKHSPVIIAAWAWKEEIELLKDLGYSQYAFKRNHFKPGNSNEEFTFFLKPYHLNENIIIG